MGELTCGVVLCEECRAKGLTLVKDPARTGRSDKPGKGSVIVGDEWAFSQYSD